MSRKFIGKYLALGLAVGALFFHASAAEEKRISVFSPAAVYSLPVVDHAGHEYVGVLELLEPLGRVSSQTGGRRLSLRYEAISAEFIDGKTRARIAGRDFDFVDPFFVENSRGFVPLASLGQFLPRFVSAPVDFHEASRRVLVGGVGIQISFRLDPANPGRLAVRFSAAVNPSLSSEPGKLRIIFKRDAVVSPGTQLIAFGGKIFTQATYSESNGDAEVDIASPQPLAGSLSNDRKAIVVSATAPKETNLPAPARATSVGQPPASPKNDTNAAPDTIHRVLVVVDPAHGGDERGAALTEKVPEKDVTLGFARLLRHELEIRGFAVRLLRDSDASLTLDQRAAAANVPGVGLYIALHGDSLGKGARVYTALLPAQGPSKGAFHTWNAAQAPALAISKTVAEAIVAEIRKRDFPARAYAASLRPLNNALVPAVAVELAPEQGGVDELASANYQQRAAAAIAEALGSVRQALGAQ